jgi:hypothetical protein
VHPEINNYPISDISSPRVQANRRATSGYGLKTKN